MTATLDPRWHTALRHSRYLSQLLAAQPTLIDELSAHWEQPLDYSALEAPLLTGDHSDDSLRTALRRLRHRVMAQLILRDLGGLAPLNEIMQTMSWLADFTPTWRWRTITGNWPPSTASRSIAKGGRCGCWSSAWASWAGAS